MTPLADSKSLVSGSSPHSYQHVSGDADDHAGNLRGWSQLYDQLSSGHFQGRIEGVCFDSLHLFRESTNRGLRQSCTVQQDAWWFGIPVMESGCYRLDARQMEGSSIAVRRGYSEFELVTPEHFDIFGIVVSRQILAAHLQPEEMAAFCELDSGLVQAQENWRLRFRQMLSEIFAEANRRPEMLLNNHASQAVQRSIAETIAQLCTSGIDRSEPGKTAAQYFSLVRKVRHFLLEHEDRVISVPEICQTFAISRRTLQYAFEDVLGIGPNAYLKLLRLNGVRRELSRPGLSGNSVQQVAANWGFWHLSQFAKDYRMHFDELPSVTLQRALIA